MRDYCEKCGHEFESYESPYYCYDCFRDLCYWCMNDVSQCKDCYEDKKRRDEEDWY